MPGTGASRLRSGGDSGFGDLFLAVTKCRNVAAFRQIDHDLIFAAFRFVIIAQTRAKFYSFSADHGIDAWIVGWLTSENVDPQERFLELVGLTIQGLFHGVPQETADAVRIRETGAGQDFFERGTNGFNGDLGRGQAGIIGVPLTRLGCRSH